MGNREEGWAAYEDAKVIWERLTEDNPAVYSYQHSLAISLLNIGLYLAASNKPNEEMAAYERAKTIWQHLVEIDPESDVYRQHLALTHQSIGLHLNRTGRSEIAMEPLQRAKELQYELVQTNPEHVQIVRELARTYSGLGTALQLTRKTTEARAFYQLAMPDMERLARSIPGDPADASQLGHTLNKMAMLELEAKDYGVARDMTRKAIEWQKQALAAKPHDATFRQFLVNHYVTLAAAAKGLNDKPLLAEAHACLAELVASDTQVKAIDERLMAVLNGAAAKDNVEKLSLAQYANRTKRFAAAARLWSEAIQSDPKLAEDRQSQHVYNASCAAALAGCGQGNDEPPPDDSTKAKLREQARTWLGDELRIWKELLETATTEQRQAIAQTLLHWQQDPDLAGTRDIDALEKLPNEERQSWQSLWSEVADVLMKAQALGATAGAGQ
jgi:tetratricopeptide (TPR) repeat protein